MLQMSPMRAQEIQLPQQKQQEERSHTSFTNPKGSFPKLQQESTPRKNLSQTKECKDKLHKCVKVKGEEQAQIYAALDPNGRNCQYTVLEAHYKGKPLTFLIDSRSSHSFISPNTAKILRVEAHPTGKKLRASSANKSSILS